MLAGRESAADSPRHGPHPAPRAAASVTSAPPGRQPGSPIQRYRLRRHAGNLMFALPLYVGVWGGWGGGGGGGELS